MTSSAELRMQPEEVADATRQLDQLAARAEKLMQNEAANLTTVAPARDEVSRRVASTLNEVHSSFGKSTDQATKRSGRWPRHCGRTPTTWWQPNKTSLFDTVPSPQLGKEV